jgi:methylphosphotriester-DNA--protein-cysteine methyltransferase
MKILITEQQFNSLLLNEGAKSLWWKEIKQAVKLVNNIDEFEIKFNQLYDSARKQGLVWYVKRLFYDKMTPEQIKKEILDGYIDENGKLVKYKGREDLALKNQKLYKLAGKISKKYNLMKGVDDILTQAFPFKYGFYIPTATVEQVLEYIESMGYKTKDEFRSKSNTLYSHLPNEVREKVMKHLEKKEGNYNYKYGFNPRKATTEQVLDYIKSMGYKTKDEFRSKGSSVYDKISKEVREKVMKHLESKERNYTYNYKYGFNLSTATFEQVLGYIKSMGYKTKDDFITKSNTVYNKIPKEVRGKVMKYFKNLDNEKKQLYNNQTSSNPNISFKYSVKESVNKILKTMI